MAKPKQNTLAGTVTLDGIGVHSGTASRITFTPAAADTGLRFKRTDLPEQPEVRADLEHVVGTDLGTNLGCGETRILTVEHVLAALAAHQVDNALLELEGPEPPIRDGSFLDYDRAIRDVKTEAQEAEAQVIRVQTAMSVDADHNESYVVAPADNFRVSASIDFEHPAIGRQYGSFPIAADTFSEELAPARTFGFKSEAESLRSRGLARGASLENTIVLDGDGVMNDSLRFPDEYVRHKVGDIVGDLALLGARVQAHIVADRPSHGGNVRLARELEAVGRKDAAEWIDVTSIMEHLPHRYPMLLVDRIIEFESGKRIVGIKNVTINEPFFQGHYPGHPVMPGVLIIEAMAQVGGLLLMNAVENPENKVVYFMSLDNVKWRKPVVPGDRLVFEVEMLQVRSRTCRMRGVGTVDGQRVAEGDLMAMIVNR